MLSAVDILDRSQALSKSQPQHIFHCIQPRRLAFQKLGGRPGALGVAIAVARLNVDFQRFAEEAEDDGVFAGVVAGADGVVADLVFGALSRVTHAAVLLLGDAHFVGDDFAEFECRAAWGIFLEAVVTFDDFGVDVGAKLVIDAGGLGYKAHREVNGSAHARREDNGYRFARFNHFGALIGTEARGAHNEGNFLFNACLRNRFGAGGSGEIDHGVAGEIDGARYRDAEGFDAGECARVLADDSAVGGVNGADELGAFRFGSNHDEPLAHFSCCAVNGDSPKLWHCFDPCGG